MSVDLEELLRVSFRRGVAPKDVVGILAWPRLSPQQVFSHRPDFDARASIQQDDKSSLRRDPPLLETTDTETNPPPKSYPRASRMTGDETKLG